MPNPPPRPPRQTLLSRIVADKIPLILGLAVGISLTGALIGPAANKQAALLEAERDRLKRENTDLTADRNGIAKQAAGAKLELNWSRQLVGIHQERADVAEARVAQLESQIAKLKQSPAEATDPPALWRKRRTVGGK